MVSMAMTTMMMVVRLRLRQMMLLLLSRGRVIVEAHECVGRSEGHIESVAESDARRAGGDGVDGVRRVQV